ncbi:MULTISPECIES: hypothetical protein [Nitrospira]|uniref:ATP synthase subunit c n=2 Tax=Nitrospira TaxID=1234 RepID=A0AA86MYV7_9BACT|nr:MULTISPECIES: hypothetical protein [Nitrospira]CAE6784394.1 putative ATP synthase subunit c [Nitrospira defluvii]CAI4031584.1 putative ATP synthase subunit c [Nitrospira tepida]
MTGLAQGDLTLLSGAILMGLALLSGALGGAVGGILVGGKVLGNELAAMMGAFFGPVASIPGVFVGLLILALLM